MSATVKEKAAQRTELDLKIDMLWHRLVSAETLELRCHYGREFTTAIRARNAARSIDEVARLEHERGLVPFTQIRGAESGKPLTYSERLRDPRWQRRRLEIMQRAGFICEECVAQDHRTLNVHHKVYRRGAMPWEYTDDELECLCEDCHRKRHAHVLGQH